MGSNNGSGELERQAHRLEATFSDVMWARNESALLLRYICKLAMQDVDDGHPDTFEKIMRLMDIYRRMIRYLLDSIDKAIQVRLENNLNTSALYELSYEAEDTQKTVDNLRLDLINWAKRVTGERPPATPEELEAEDERTRQLYIRCGVPLPPGLVRGAR